MQNNKRLRTHMLACAALVLTTACLFFRGGKPKVENFPSPELSIQADGFDQNLCPEQDGRHICSPESALGVLGCEEIRPIGDLLGGLRPIYPMRVCLAGKPGAPAPPENEYVYREGCLLSKYVRYVALKDGEYLLINSKNALREQFAPIENDLEALSYVLAASGLGVRFDLQPEAGLRYFTDELQDTFVKQTERGYLVHLYDYQVCGCGPHTTYTVDFIVSPDGQIEEIARQKAFEDPAEDSLCVD